MSYRGKLCFSLLAVGMLLLISCGGGHSDNTSAAAPIANAGTNQSVMLGATVTLNGTGSTGASTYAWTLTSVPAGSSATLSGATTASPTFIPDIGGVYIARLVVTNAAGASAPATVSVAVSVDNLLTNVSFESGLTGWTVATNLAGGAVGTCSYNAAVAPGTETLTSVVGFPPTDGTNIALGSVSETNNSGAIVSCVLYQDVAIPEHASTATFSFNIGTKDAANGNNLNNAAVVGIYSPATIPAFGDSAVAGGVNGKINYGSPADVILQSRTSSVFNISSRAGTTVRFAIINAANVLGHQVIGMDRVKLTVNVAAP